MPSIKASNEHPNEVAEAVSDLCEIVVCLDDVAAEVDAPGSSKVAEAIHSDHAFITPTSSLPPGFEYINDEDFSIVESIPSESLEDLVEKLEQSIDCAQSAEGNSERDSNYLYANDMNHRTCKNLHTEFNFLSIRTKLYFY